MTRNIENRFYPLIDNPHVGMFVHIDETGKLFRADTMDEWQPDERFGRPDRYKLGCAELIEAGNAEL